MAVTDVRLPAGNGIPENERRNLTVVWVLYLATLLTGSLTAWIGIIIAHIKRGDASSHEAYENYTYAIYTFWGTVIATLVGVALTVIGLGYFIILGAGLWFIYRSIKGLLRTNDNRSAYDN
jgi:uncharacterized membrane protein